MDGLSLLRDARAAGLKVAVQGDRLVIRGPRRAEPVARLLIEHKPEVMAVLVGRGTESTAAPTRTLTDRAAWGAADWHTLYNEFARARQLRGQRSREKALHLAWSDTLAAYHRARSKPPPGWQCAGCDQPIGCAGVMDIWGGARVHFDTLGLTSYGRRWRSAAAGALAAMGLAPPPGEGMP